MVRPLNTPTSGAELLQLDYAERLAVWSLRQLIGRELPRCASRSARTARSFGDDLALLGPIFREALYEIKQAGDEHPHVDGCASLAVTRDEHVLLRCLAGMQHGWHQAERPLVIIIPERRGREFFEAALQALAAALAACGYWLSDVEISQLRLIPPATNRWRVSNEQAVFA